MAEPPPVEEDPGEDDPGEDDPGETLPANEQRIHERFRINLKALIRLSDGSIATAQAVDLSMGGIYLEYGASADAGKVFELAFDLPLSSDFKRVIVKAQVVRTVVIGNRGLYGLAFVFKEFAAGAEKNLKEYMELRKLKTM